MSHISGRAGWWKPPSPVLVRASGEQSPGATRHSKLTVNDPNPEASHRPTTVRLWPTELGHLVQDVTRDHGLGHSPASGPGAKPVPDNRFVPKERILHPRLELVAGLLLPAAPAERPHVRDRAISRARPRPTPRHPRGLGRWNHDSRVTHLRRFVERDRIVGRVHRVRSPRRPRPPCFTAAHSPSPTIDSPVLSMATENRTFVATENCTLLGRTSRAERTFSR